PGCEACGVADRRAAQLCVELRQKPLCKVEAVVERYQRRQHQRRTRQLDVHKAQQLIDAHEGHLAGRSIHLTTRRGEAVTGPTWRRLEHVLDVDLDLRLRP